jgi:hypothetical protein
MFQWHSAPWNFKIILLSIKSIRTEYAILIFYETNFVRTVASPDIWCPRRVVKSQWPPLTEFMNFKKSQLFIYFPYMRLSNLKFVECWKSCTFYLEYSFRRPFNCAGQTAFTTRPSPTTTINYASETEMPTITQHTKTIVMRNMGELRLC